MKQLIIIFIFLSLNCTAQNISECDYLKLSIEYLMKNEKVINNIHSDIKTRLPYNFKTKLLCEMKSADFNIVSYDNKTQKSIVDVTLFEISGDIIKLNLYYKENGTGINSLLKINNKYSLEVIGMDVYEN